MPVAIVVDPTYTALEELSQQMPVWAVSCPAHRATAKRIWPSQREAGNFMGLTLYDVGDETAAEANCLNIIDNVDLHHGVHSSGSKIDMIKIVGTPLSEAIKKEFQTYGFTAFETTEDGFIAKST